MVEVEQHQTGGNLVSAIVVAISVALIMVLTTFLIFINSSSYTTVKQIQSGSRIARAIQSSDVDTRSPIKADDIDVYQKSIDQRLNNFDDGTDFGSNSVSDQLLGLSQ